MSDGYDGDLYDSFEEAVGCEVSSTGYSTLTIEGEEYLIFDDLEDAEQMAIRDIENLINDIGIDSFSGGVTDVALNTVGDDYFYDIMKDNYSGYAKDIENKESSNDEIYLNRLHEEMCDYGVMEEMDLETKKDEFVEALCDEYDSGKEWFEEQFGRDELLRVINDKELYDKQEVAEYILDTDGLGHILASYNGKEHEQDGYLIYRVA